MISFDTIETMVLYDLMPTSKGQIISKGLFGVLELSQKTNERIRCSSKNEFICLFFGRIRQYQKSFRNYLTFKLISKLIQQVSGLH